MLKFGNTYLNFGGTYLTGWKVQLPPGTVRVRTSDGKVPYKETYTTYETATLVPGTTDVYDVYKSGTNFYRLLAYSNNVIEVLEANTSNVTNMRDMFYSCTSLTTVPLFDTSNVTDMQQMFGHCTHLTTVPLFDTSSVTNMYEMFSQCSALQYVPLLDTSKVTDMGEMFYHCDSLTNVPLFNTSNVTSMLRMFAYCTSLQSVPLFDTSKVRYMYDMFWYCTNVHSGTLALYQQASTQTTPPTRHDGTFRNCGSNTETGSAELAQIPSDWK